MGKCKIYFTLFVAAYIYITFRRKTYHGNNNITMYHIACNVQSFVMLISHW